MKIVEVEVVPLTGATVEGGKPVRYELPAASARAATRGVAPAAATAAVVTGDVGGVPLRVTVTAPTGTDAHSLGTDLLRELRAVRR